jgi:hypothetical protein
MIPKGISHTVQNPTYEFQKRNIRSIQEIINFIQNYRSLLLVWQICSLNWDLDMDSFVRTLSISCDDPVAIHLLVMQGGQSLNLWCYVYYFFRMTSLGA